MKKKYRLSITIYLQEITTDAEGREFLAGSGLNTSVSHDLTVATIREASDIMLKYHDVAQAVMAQQP